MRLRRRLQRRCERCNQEKKQGSRFAHWTVRERNSRPMPHSKGASKNAEQIAEMGFYFHEVKDCILLAVAESGPEVVEVKHLQL